jgi:predicted nucleic acid-binding protein
MIFVDTGAWYASLVPNDPDHARAVQWLTENHSPLLTTDYVIDERKRVACQQLTLNHSNLSVNHSIQVQLTAASKRKMLAVFASTLGCLDFLRFRIESWIRILTPLPNH